MFTLPLVQAQGKSTGLSPDSRRMSVRSGRGLRIGRQRQCLKAGGGQITKLTKHKVSQEEEAGEQDELAQTEGAQKLIWVVSANTNSSAASLMWDICHIRIVSVVFCSPFFFVRFYRRSSKLPWLSWQHGSQSQRGALGMVSDHVLHCGQSILAIQWQRTILCMHRTPPPATWWLHCKSFWLCFGAMGNCWIYLLNASLCLQDFLHRLCLFTFWVVVCSGFVVFLLKCAGLMRAVETEPKTERLWAEQKPKHWAKRC